jgi:ornithine cyclodeaminase
MQRRVFAERFLPDMLIFDRQAVADALPYARLVDALADAFAGATVTPPRTLHTLPVPGESDATLLLMPAWQQGAMLGIKIATVFPDNVQRGLASVQASYLLLDATSGTPLAILDGAELTLRRTAAASALASRYLSREDAAILLMVGTGKLAPHMIAAHAAVRPITEVLIWGRRPSQAQQLAATLASRDLDVKAASSLVEAAAAADIICCATLSSEPLIRGSWLQPGQHIDLVGAFTPAMCEADAAALTRSRVFVDTYEGALSEAGEIVQAMRTGLIVREDLLADLAGLVRAGHAGRDSASDITLFKSVGTAIEDLAAASCVMQSQAPGSRDESR